MRENAQRPWFHGVGSGWRSALGDGVRLGVTGIVVGLIAAVALTPLPGKMLYGVGPRDVVTFACVAVLMAAVALAAGYNSGAARSESRPNGGASV